MRDDVSIAVDREWLETDGAGGYATGTVSLVCTRKYHGVLVFARNAPVDRLMLVNRVDVALLKDDTRLVPTSIDLVEHDPHPVWALSFPNGARLIQELVMCQEPRMVAMRWAADGLSEGTIFEARPWLTCRDHHTLHYRNPNFNFDVETHGRLVQWTPYISIPTISAVHTGAYHHDPDWLVGVEYTEEKARGYESQEDLASPGSFHFDVQGAMTLAFSAEHFSKTQPAPNGEDVGVIIKKELARRRKLGDRLKRSADQFIVSRGRGHSIIAGYPWFNDWGRDTMIAARGLAIATGRRRISREILMTWVEALSEGMLPNNFPNTGPAKYNSVDAPLWFVVAAYEHLRSPQGEFPGKYMGRLELQNAISDVVYYYGERGTRYGICAGDDGLLRAGDEHTQLTWMDANVDGEPVTPRHGKPVEIQALWLNALWIAGQIEPKWNALFRKGVESFREQFWNDAEFLADCKNADETDCSLRPNQILAVGGLPCVLVSRNQAHSIVDAVEHALWIPTGLRTVSPHAECYLGAYAGAQPDRDAAYHQGTAWPWLLGPFVEAWLRVRDFADEAIEEARTRFIAPWEAELDNAGLGHVSEVFDGDEPHHAGGCPFQAWSLSELIRVKNLLDDPARLTGVWIDAKDGVPAHG